jgi:alpha-tubulin suppressor-like RCC1 family protein
MNSNLTTASRIRLALVCLLALEQFVHATSPPGWVVEWGYDSSAGAARTPKVVLSNTVAVSLGRSHGLALRSDRTVTGWGWNLFGQATGGEPFERAVKAETVRIGGGVLSNVVAIAAGHEFSLALKTDGTLATWGQNYIPKELTNAVAIAAAGYSSAAVRTDGSVVAWFSDPSMHQYGEVFPAMGVSNAIAVALGETTIDTRNVALLTDGTVTTWGHQSVYRDEAPPAGLSGVVAIAASGGHALALKRDGTVIGWGSNKSGQATGTPTTAIPWISAGPVWVEGRPLTNIASVAAAEGYSLARTRDGRLMAWGRMVNALYPATVPPGLSNVVAIAAGWDSCVAVTTNSLVAERFRTGH